MLLFYSRQTRTKATLLYTFSAKKEKILDNSILFYTTRRRVLLSSTRRLVVSSPGVVQNIHLPAGNGVRVDTALYAGYRIPAEYDSMIAKVIVHAPDRPAAIRRMLTALDEMVITGVDTNLDFQFQIIRSKVFREGKADTGFIEKFMNLKEKAPEVPEV